ncbi:MAG: radical SAM protein [bacterium]|nr:radical SAM protein [bacterium]
MASKDLRICLIQPGMYSYIRSVGKNFRPEPLASLPLLYLGAVLQKEGFANINIINCIADKEMVTKRDKEFVRTTIPTPNLKRKITEFKPDVIGITCMYSQNLPEAVSVAQIAKKVCPGVPVILGGVHITGQPKETLSQYNCFDIAVVGEGERTIVELIKHIDSRQDSAQLKNINGICFRQNDEIILTPPREFISDLDSIPFPAYELADLKTFPNVYMLTSRGCPFKCIFCAAPINSGRKWRAHSIDYLIEHIKILRYKYNIKHIPFLDDNFAFNLERVSEFTDRVLAEKLDFQWDVIMRAEKISKELLLKMKKAGCQYVTIGVESGDQEFLNKVVKKNLKIADVIRFTDLCEEINMPLTVLFMVGIPGENKEIRRKTRELQRLLWKKRCVTGMALSIATPFAGTELYETCKEKGYFEHKPTPEEFAKTFFAPNCGLIKTNDFTPKDAIKFTMQSYFTQLSGSPGKLLRKSFKYYGKAISKLSSIIKLYG